MHDTLRHFYDAIVIGSGAGGSTLIYQLTRLKRKVLLVERGPFFDTIAAAWI